MVLHLCTLVESHFMTQRSPEAPGGDKDLRLVGVKLRRLLLGGGDGDRLLALTGEGDRAGFLTGDIDLCLGAGEMDLPPRLGTGDKEALLRLTGEIDLPLRLTGLSDRRSTSYLGADSIMTESPE